MQRVRFRVFRKALLLLALLSVAATQAAFAGRFVSSPPGAIRDRWLVLLEDSRELPEKAGLLRPVHEVAEELLASFPGRRPLRVYENAVRGFAVELPPQAARALSRSPEVLLVEQDRLIQVQAPPCPIVTFGLPSVFPASPQQISCPVFYGDNCNDNWGLDRVDQQTLPLNNLFYFGSNGTGVHLYFLDTGIDYTHPEFKNAQGVSRVGTSINLAGDGVHATDPYYPPVTPTYFYDPYGHGTHVAAIAAGLRFGVAKNATIHAVRVTNAAAVSATSVVAQGVDWIARNHVKPAVVNISMNFNVAREEQQGNTVYLNFMETLFRNLVQVHGVTVVNSAGNFNRDAYDFSPSRLPELIVVGASDYYDERWREAPAFQPCNIRPSDPYSQCGSNFGSSLDLWAPGYSIVSAWQAGGACRQTGTSLAAPMVAGVAATYLQTHPAALPAEVVQALVNNSSVGVLNGSTLGSAATPNRLLRTFP
jgi:subtilisin family serine protease